MEILSSFRGPERKVAMAAVISAILALTSSEACDAFDRDTTGPLPAFVDKDKEGGTDGSSAQSDEGGASSDGGLGVPVLPCPASGTDAGGICLKTPVQAVSVVDDNDDGGPCRTYVSGFVPLPRGSRAAIFTDETQQTVTIAEYGNVVNGLGVRTSLFSKANPSNSLQFCAAAKNEKNDAGFYTSPNDNIMDGGIRTLSTVPAVGPHEWKVDNH